MAVCRSGPRRRQTATDLRDYRGPDLGEQAAGCKAAAGAPRTGCSDARPCIRRSHRPDAPCGELSWGREGWEEHLFSRAPIRSVGAYWRGARRALRRRIGFWLGRTVRPRSDGEGHRGRAVWPTASATITSGRRRIAAAKPVRRSVPPPMAGRSSPRHVVVSSTATGAGHLGVLDSQNPMFSQAAGRTAMRTVGAVRADHPESRRAGPPDEVLGRAPGRGRVHAGQPGGKPFTATLLRIMVECDRQPVDQDDPVRLSSAVDVPDRPRGARRPPQDLGIREHRRRRLAVTR